MQKPVFITYLGKIRVNCAISLSMKKLILITILLISSTLYSREMYPEETIVGPDSTYGLVLLKDIKMNDYRKNIFFIDKKIVNHVKGADFYCELSNGRSKKEIINLSKNSRFVFDSGTDYFSWQGAIVGRIWRQYWLLKDNDDVQYFKCINKTDKELNYELIKSAVGNYLKLTKS